MSDTPNTVVICRAPGSGAASEYPVDRIQNPRWDHTAGGRQNRYGYYALYGYIPYEDAAKLVDCSGTHGSYGSEAKICICESDNQSPNNHAAYRKLVKIAGDKPKSIIAQNRPKNAPLCTKRIRQIMSEKKQLFRPELRNMILEEGYQLETFRRALKTLLKKELSCQGGPNSPKQVIFWNENKK